MSIWKKLLAVQSEAETIPKSGYNSFQKYKYATEEDVLSIRQLMNKHGLVAYPDVVGYETLTRNDAIQMILHVEYSVIDADSGETFKVKVVGQGEDKGDKGTYKAMTGANKYFYLKLAGCATGDDPERVSESRFSRAPKPNQEKPKSNITPIQSQPPAVNAVPPEIKEILRIQKERGLSQDELLRFCEVETLRGLSKIDAVAALDKLSIQISEIDQAMM